MPTWWNGRHKRLKISGLNRPCQFESGRGYQIILPFPFKIWLKFLISAKKELKIRQKGTLLCQTAWGEIKKLLFASVDRFRDRLVSFCGKASGVNRPVARSFVVEAKFLDFALFKVNGLLLS